MNVKVGPCPDSRHVWFGEDPGRIPWRRFLDEMAEAGYEWIEPGPYQSVAKVPRASRPGLRPPDKAL